MFALEIEGCPREDVDALSRFLEETPCLSLMLTDQQDNPILEPELGTTPLWPDVVIQVLYAEEQEAEIARLCLASQYPHLNSRSYALPEQNWERVCMDNFKSQRFGQKLWICPSWETPPDPSAVNLSLDPGLAFGTGTHPTTHLCLTWLDKAVLDQKTVVDYGCGSGVLGLAALKLGAQHVIAVDIDEQALLATRNNACKNRISSRDITVDYPTAVIPPADLVLANILLSPLTQLETRFHEILKHHGTLVVSGILATQVETLIEAYATHFTHQATVTLDNWALLVFENR